MEIVIIIGALLVLVGVMATLVRYNNAANQPVVKKVTPEIKPIAIEYRLTAKKVKPVQKAKSNKTSQKRKTR